MKNHEKHIKLEKPQIGFFHRNELSLVGAPCPEIENLAAKICMHLGQIAVTYVDADHTEEVANPLKWNTLSDKINHFRFEKKSLSSFDKKLLLHDQDLVLVNGNHFQANKQLVLIHPKKEESIKKRLSQLTDVQAYVLCEGAEAPFDWLLENIGQKPVFRLEQFEQLAKIVEKIIAPPPIKALVLAGGKSQRMGEDKGQICYHGKPQVDFLFEELDSLGLETFISCQYNQYTSYKRIIDKFDGLGPFGAIASAFQTDPNSAWLVVACDLPLVDRKVFELLLTTRKASLFATCFFNPETNFPDPLLTLWEPRAYLRMMEFLAMGYSCPRKVLINSKIELISLANPEFLKNINTPGERAAFIQ